MNVLPSKNLVLSEYNQWYKQKQFVGEMIEDEDVDKRECMDAIRQLLMNTIHAKEDIKRGRRVYQNRTDTESDEYSLESTINGKDNNTQ